MEEKSKCMLCKKPCPSWLLSGGVFLVCPGCLDRNKCQGIDKYKAYREAAESVSSKPSKWKPRSHGIPIPVDWSSLYTPWYKRWWFKFKKALQ